jgi:hypothetical protein
MSDEVLAIDGHESDDNREEMNPGIATLLAENARGFDLLLAEFRRDCKPANSAEDALVQLMARHFWHSLRKTRVETGLVESQMELALENHLIREFAQRNDIKDPAMSYEFDTRRLGVAFDHDCGKNNSQLKITRACAASDHGFLNAQARLQKMQDHRQARYSRKQDLAA